MEKLNLNHRAIFQNLAKKIKEECNANNWKINNIESKPTSSSPAPPFTTSTLQQDASRRFGFSPKRTMVVAQKLYEQGFITYMRTDSTHLSSEALNASKTFIKESFGNEFLSDKTNVFKNKVANAQEAHEAIRPAGTKFRNVKDVQKIGLDEAKLYELILSRTVASQMKPAQYIRTNVEIFNGLSIFKASGNVTVFKGYTLAYEQALTRKDKAKPDSLPALSKESKIESEDVLLEEKTTSPPRRFSEAMLVKEMETRGIGRPSTYSAIIEKLSQKEYVVKKNKTLIPTFVGIAVSITSPAQGKVNISIADTITSTIKPGRHVYDIMLTRPSGSKIIGVEGYVESSAIGLLSSIFIIFERNNMKCLLPPDETALASLLNHVTKNANRETFQPMNINFGLFPNIENSQKLPYFFNQNIICLTPT